MIMANQRVNSNLDLILKTVFMSNGLPTYLLPNILHRDIKRVQCEMDRAARSSRKQWD